MPTTSEKIRLKLVVHEVTAGHSRDYHTIDAIVPANSTSRLKGDYDMYKAFITGHPLACNIPIPWDGDIDIYRNGVCIGRFTYRTPTHPDPDHGLQVPMPGGMIGKFTRTAPIALPATLPLYNWLQCGRKGDPSVLQIKLKRVGAAHNIHSDQLGNMFIYTVEKVYLYEKHL